MTKLAKPNKLVTALSSRKHPVQAQRLCDLYGGRPRAWRRRAEYSAGMVIGTKDGYVMTNKATVPQMRNWRARYNGQIQEMKARARAVERIFFQRCRVLYGRWQKRVLLEAKRNRKKSKNSRSK